MPTVPYVKQTWTDGVSSASAARLTVIENGINDVSFAPAVRVTHNANQSITSGVLTALAFNTERFDQAGNTSDTQHDNVTNNSRLTCRYAGVYQITGLAAFAPNATGIRQIQIRLNATTIIASTDHIAASAGTGSELAVTSLYSLAVNDFVELMALQTSGAGLNVNQANNYTPEFMMVRVA